MDYGILITAFKDPIVYQLLARVATISPLVKKDKQPITRDILAQVVIYSLLLLDINIDTVFTLTFTRILQMGKIIYAIAELKNQTIFLIKKAT